MPELPDVVVYCESLQRFYRGQTLTGVDVSSPFLVRTFEPEISGAVGSRLESVERLGKRLLFVFDRPLYLLFHLMFAGRFHRRRAGSKPRRKNDLAAFHFADDTLMLTEASRRHRASLHVFADYQSAVADCPQGLEVLAAELADFRRALVEENHTLKRGLTDPNIFSGIGNAYSDEILHAARLSPIALTQRLTEAEISRLYDACQHTLLSWTERIREEVGDGFPEKVTAFRDQMCVHGRFGQPCPTCGTSVARIRYANNETNYCPRCQTGGKLLADRSLSRLLKDDWPRSIE